MNVNLLWSSQLFHTRCSWVPQNRMLFVAFSFQCCANALEIAFTARGLVAQPTCFQLTRSLYVPTTFWDCTKQCTRGSAPTSVSEPVYQLVYQGQCTREPVHQLPFEIVCLPAGLLILGHHAHFTSQLGDTNAAVVLNTAFIFTDTISGWIQE